MHVNQNKAELALKKVEKMFIFSSRQSASKFYKINFMFELLIILIQLCNAFYVPNQNDEKIIEKMPICNLNCCCQEYQQRACQNCCCCNLTETNDENNRNNNDLINSDIYLDNKLPNYGVNNINGKPLENKEIIYPIGDQSLQNQLQNEIKNYPYYFSTIETDKSIKSDLNKNFIKTVFVPIPAFFSPINNNKEKNDKKSQLIELNNEKISYGKFMGDKIKTDTKSYENFDYCDNNICNYDNYDTENELENNKSFENNSKTNDNNFNGTKKNWIFDNKTEKLKNNNKTEKITIEFDSTIQNNKEFKNSNFNSINKDANFAPTIDKIQFNAKTTNQQNINYNNNQKNETKEFAKNITKILNEFSSTTIQTTNEIENVQKPFIPSPKNFGSNAPSSIIKNKSTETDISESVNKNQNQTSLLNVKDNLKIELNKTNDADNNPETLDPTTNQTQNLIITTKKINIIENFQNTTIQTTITKKLLNNNLIEEKTTKILDKNLTSTPTTKTLNKNLTSTSTTKEYTEAPTTIIILSTQLNKSNNQNESINFLSTTPIITTTTITKTSKKILTTTNKFNENKSKNLIEDQYKTTIKLEPLLINETFNTNLSNKNLNNQTNEIKNETLTMIENDLKLSDKNQTTNDILQNQNGTVLRLKFHSLKNKKLTNQNKLNRTRIKFSSHPEKRHLKINENTDASTIKLSDNFFETINATNNPNENKIKYSEKKFITSKQFNQNKAINTVIPIDQNFYKQNDIKLQTVNQINNNYYKKFSTKTLPILTNLKTNIELKKSEALLNSLKFFPKLNDKNALLDDKNQIIQTKINNKNDALIIKKTTDILKNDNLFKIETNKFQSNNSNRPKIEMHEAISVILCALKELVLRAKFTSKVNYLVGLLKDKEFANNNFHTGWLDARIAAKVQCALQLPLDVAIVISATVIGQARISEVFFKFQNALERRQILPKSKLTETWQHISQ